MRYILKVCYDGKNYFGFQIQKDRITIQEVLTNALSKVLNFDVSIIASGRTDTGVSALCQVCHFDYENELDFKKTKNYLNAILPDDIRVLAIENASSDFHARFSATKKTYEYLFYFGNEIPVYNNFATFVNYNLSIDSMIEACKYIKGEHDFTCFCSSKSEVESKIRNIYDIGIKRIEDNLYKFYICGNGFLYNMVRIIMGTLVEVGRQKIMPTDIQNIIKNKDRALSGKTMSSRGLYLKNVEY